MKLGERAREGEATEEERAKAAKLGAVVGASELISPLRILNIFKKGLGDDAVNGLIDRGRRVLYASGEEGLQEFGAAVAQNFIEQGIYNPEQGTFAGTREPALYGAGVGGFVQAITDMIAPRSRGGRRDVTKTEDTGSREGAPVDSQGEQGAEGPTDIPGATKTKTTRVGTAGADVGDDTTGEGTENVTLEGGKADPRNLTEEEKIEAQKIKEEIEKRRKKRRERRS